MNGSYFILNYAHLSSSVHNWETICTLPSVFQDWLDRYKSRNAASPSQRMIFAPIFAEPGDKVGTVRLMINNTSGDVPGEIAFKIDTAKYNAFAQIVLTAPIY